MISAEAPIVLEKACELFIMELTLRSWNAALETKHKVMQKSDVANAISKSEMYDCNLYIVIYSLD
jgi:nuclear transcription factor Y gamma